MPEEQPGEEVPTVFREHYVTWRGLILFLQQVSQKKQKKQNSISQNALLIYGSSTGVPVWYDPHASTSSASN